MMESTRVAEVLKLEVREQLRVDELRKGAAKIRAQIEERREAALLEQEKKDQETKLLLKQIADTNEAERVHKASKVAAQKKLMQGVNAANDASKELKKVQKMKDEDEDRKVLEYILAKEAKEAESDRIAGVKRGERELELSRLRAAQEKVSVLITIRWLTKERNRMHCELKEHMKVTREIGERRRRRGPRNKPDLSVRFAKRGSNSNKPRRMQ